MNTTAKDIADVLHAARTTLGLLGIPTAAELSSDWGVYYGVIPDAPARMVALTEGTPPPPLASLDKSEPVREEPLQLRVRGNSYAETFALLNKLTTHLYTSASWIVTTGTETTRYLSILHGSGILSLGQDDRRRFTQAVNLRVYRIRES